MKALFWIGIVVLILGIASLVVPIPRNEREGFKAGGLSVGIETQHQEKVSPIVSAAMILCGAGLLIAGKRKS
ncbi:MAG: hypothetical protein DMG58_16685 [Acidobacteria bacterium]|nr:MAG: hypothetical protein DMG58_16685 [Acidobacteriota bacterium]